MVRMKMFYVFLILLYLTSAVVREGFEGLTLSPHGLYMCIFFFRTYSLNHLVLEWS